MKKLLFIINNAPYVSLEQQENIEMILAAASFGCEVAVLFQGLGVLQLVDAVPPLPPQKSLAKMIAAFPAFDVNKVYAIQEDMQQAELKLNQLACKVPLIRQDQIQGLIQQYKIVIQCG